MLCYSCESPDLGSCSRPLYASTVRRYAGERPATGIHRPLAISVYRLVPNTACQGSPVGLPPVGATALPCQILIVKTTVFETIWATARASSALQSALTREEERCLPPI
jgi:hypothetical protein